MRHLILIAACLVLAACAHTNPPEAKIVFKEVLVPVSKPCVTADVSPTPAYADTRQALIDATPDQGNFLLQQEWPRKEARLNLLEGVLAACR